MGEVDTSAITEAILASGKPPTLSVVTSIPADDQRITGREEPLRSQGGRNATRGDGLPQGSQQGGPAFAARRCLGNQRAPVPVSRRIEDERSVEYPYLTVPAEYSPLFWSRFVGEIADTGAGTNSH
jgi:hypothetical protein